MPLSAEETEWALEGMDNLVSAAMVVASLRNEKSEQHPLQDYAQIVELTAPLAMRLLAAVIENGHHVDIEALDLVEKAAVRLAYSLKRAKLQIRMDAAARRGEEVKKA